MGRRQRLGKKRVRLGLRDEFGDVYGTRKIVFILVDLLFNTTANQYGTKIPM